MSKDKISDYSATANSNTDIAGINIDEGCAPSGINDAIRTLMKQLKDFQTGTASDPLTVGGVLTVTAGSASVPAITTSGDTNTGIAFPAADTVAIATGGTERARVDSSGNLGLGVTPSAWGSSYKALEFLGNSFIGNTGGGTQFGLGLNFYRNSSGQYIYKTTAAATYYEQYAGTHAWLTAASGTAGNPITFTQAMTLDASGRLLVGATTGPSGTAFQTLASGSGSNEGGIQLTYGGGGGGGVSSAGGAGLRFFSFTGANGSESYTERARIDSSGNLLVGTTSGTSHSFWKSISGDWAVNIRNTQATLPYGLDIYFSGAAPNNTSSPFIYCEDQGGTQRAAIRSNGGLANYSGNNVNLSDRREKTNFAPAGNYLAKICAIPVQTFNYIDQNLEEDAGLTLGVVAQDVQAVAPELVMESNWAPKDEEPKMRLSIYQTDLQYALMKCIQEQQALITSLTERITALENK